MEIIGVTSTKSEKDGNVTWVLEVCQTMLKNQESMPKVIITDHDITLMNSVARLFPT